jgi:hypothetical protein
MLVTICLVILTSCILAQTIVIFAVLYAAWRQGPEDGKGALRTHWEPRVVAKEQ